MAWVWFDRLDTPFKPAEFDYGSPVQPDEAISSMPIDPFRGPAIFRTRANVGKFNALHCPPLNGPPAVDKVWQDIIRHYVPNDLVQFYPITLVGRDGESHKFSWVVPFSLVRCIDPQRSNVLIKEEKPEITLIFLCDYYVHRENCLGSLHLARDEQKATHLVVSDELRDALAATGESSMFYRPEDLPVIGGPVVH